MPGFSALRKTTLTAAYRAMHELADKFEPRVRRAFLEAIEELRGSVTLVELQAAIEAGNVDRVMSLLGWDDFSSGLRGMGRIVRDELVLAATYHGAELGYSFDLLNPQSASFIRQYEFNLIRALESETREGIRSIVLDAFEEGDHPYQQAREIRMLIGLTERQSNAVSNYWDTLLEGGESDARAEELAMRYYGRLLNYRAQTIARTETIRAAGMGREATWRQALDAGLLDPMTTRRRWLITPDDRLCEICQAIPEMNPEGVGFNEPFRTPNGYEMQEPAHPNCFSYDSKVHNAHVLGASDRFYEGDVVTLEFAGGDFLTCTPHHQILTLHGWVEAEFLNEGSQVLRTRARQGVTLAGRHDNDHVPTLIGEVAEALLSSAGVAPTEVPVTAEDFHGDGTGSQVAVIGAYGSLLVNFKTQFTKHRRQLVFRLRDIAHIALYALCSVNELLLRGLRAAARYVGIENLVHSLGLSHAGPLDTLGVAVVTQDDVVFTQKSVDDSARRFIFVRELIGRHPGQVFVDNVVRFRRKPFSDHVYNLETEGQLYTCNGVIVHNCRCSVVLDFIDEEDV